MELFVIISIISSVFSIILFFKIWGMTNDVREIKNSLKSDIDVTCLATGDVEGTKQALCKLFTEQIRTFVNMVQKGEMSEQQAISRSKGLASSYNEKAKKLGIEIKFDEIAEYIVPKMLEMNNRL